MSQICRFAGEYLTANQAIVWEVSTGTAAYRTTIETEARTVDRILAQGPGPHRLEIIDRRGVPLVVNGVWLLGEGAGASKRYFKQFLIADSRWLWTRKIVVRRYNISRRSGERRVTQPGFAPVAVQEIDDDVVFASWSLDAGRAWTFTRMLADVMAEIQPDGDVLLPVSFEGDAIILQDVLLADPGHTALDKLLSRVARLSPFVDPTSGAIRFRDALDGSERARLAAFGPITDPGNVIRVPDLSSIRPLAVNVGFMPEYELRVDTVTEGSAATVSGPDESRFAENVLPVPDPTITLANGREVTQGTWTTVDDYIGGLNLILDAGLPPITQDLLRRTYHSEFAELLNLYGRMGDEGVLDPIWRVRIATIRAHWRLTYRINRRVMDRLLSIRANLVAIRDDETGHRAKSPVYADYAIRPSLRGIVLGLGQAYFGANTEGYAARIEDARRSPADVRILDADLGIIRFDFRGDAWGIASDVLPSFVLGMPTADVGDWTATPIAWDSVVFGGAPNSETDTNAIRLSDSHRIATILTALPGAPNGNRQLHFERVEPTEVADLIGDPGRSLGPEWTIIVGSQVETARFAWSDDRAADIDAALGIIASDQRPDIRELLVNPERVRAVARAEAARLYARLKNIAQGVQIARLTPSMLPGGAIASVRHVLGQDGAATTTITCMAEPPERDLWALVPPEIRASILNEVQVE